jgi:hypothetical protein
MRYDIMIHTVICDGITREFYDEKSARKYQANLKLAGKESEYNQFERGCQVNCHYCHGSFYETDPRIEMTNIEENILGQDVVTFKCPKCGKDTTSLRVG